MSGFEDHIFARCALAALVAMLIAQAPASEPSHASADELPLGRVVAAADSVGAATSDTGPWLLRTLGALGLVVLLIFGVRLLIGRRARAGEDLGDPLVELLARSNILPRTQILFLRINQRVIVAAQTPQGVSALAVLDEPDDVAWLLSRVQPRGFRAALAKHQSEPNTGDARAQLAGVLGRIRAAREKGGRL